MKIRFLALLALAATVFVAPKARADQPLLSVSMTEIDVSGGNIYGSNAPAYPTGGVFPVNGGYGPYTSTVTLWGLATGTFPTSGFTYTFYVNGQVIGNAVNVPSANNDAYPQAVSWTPPQPGTYYFSVTATDGQHSATSLAVEYFATGINIVSPIANQIVPVGSSVVIQAAAAVNAGAVSKVEFRADGVTLGYSSNYPYSIIYTPPGPANTVHFISARSYLSDGVTIGASTPAQGIQMVSPVLPLPNCSIGYPAATTPPTTIPIPDYTSNASNAIDVTVNAGAGGGGTITQVQLYINGVLFGTQTALPYNFTWQPKVGGTYYLTALAYDGKNNVIASTTSTTASTTPAPTTVIVGSLPSVGITSPASGATLSAGAPTSLTATATDTNTDISGNPVGIQSVTFFQDGNSVGSAVGLPGVSSYTITFNPVQKIDATTGQPVASTIYAVATDNLGFQATSQTITVKVNTGAGGGGVTVGTPPTVTLTAPVNNANVTVNQPVTFAATASAPNGYVQSVSFLVDSTVVGTASSYPYTFSWTPKNLGFYNIVAQVIGNLGDKVNSTQTTVYVVAPPVPTVSITAPSAGSILTVNSPITITASATSSTGTISQVQFFSNGSSIGTVTSPPYSISYTPSSTGIYNFTATATDYANQTSTSSAVAVEVAPQNNSTSTLTFFGNYQGLTDSGVFALAVVDGTLGMFIGQQRIGTSSSPAYLPDISVSSGGALYSSANSISGSAVATGTNGSLSGGETFIGAPAGSGSAPAGYFTGTLGGIAGSSFTAIVGTDGQIMVYVANGSYTDTAYGAAGSINSDGTFSILTAKKATLSGAINASTYLFSASLSGSNGGNLIGARVSGGTFSDGTLRNLSTRGPVASGASAMVAGFVVSGNASKNLLIRAVGPALSTYGITNALAQAQLTVYNASGGVVGANLGWSSTASNASAVSAAELQTGAFALPVGSFDSAIVGSFAPGAYTANVAGASGSTGVGLVEVWDLDSYSPFTTNKLVNVSTRANVGTGQSVMIGGLVINGNAPKKVLICGVGPTLSSFGVSGVLSTPHLQLINSKQQVILENFTWGTGNDTGLVTAAAKASGAFALPSGSADSTILAVLAPGTYTVELSSAGTATGVALIEVYEVP
jgi:Bacterial Ig domain